MIYVVATIEVAPGARDQFLTEFRQLVPLVLAEEGCIEYGPTIDATTSIAAQGPPREDIVTVVEKWDTVEALEKHLIAPHMIQYRETVKDLVRGTTLQVLQPA